ncbi:clustered-asparagine-rich protein, putative [Plasmodium berghei]|uniref:Clustered-asparagine-rich protein, putative n=2 Tax=Plasmodium berghei TaxID=5821 RepID=A0A509AS81_PLABA|nr:clustered-asparagine-rich protein, putative [Plasmodium berghei ANKA]CXJ25837.1 clustered-asparagine-rich protein, putative [Plasmodium berghei]SCM26889.1 clustered-asparagine-rich protein, putative [Plasmodium berghei]SCN28687.1 clustered-asparagine-rich protein, putative [Plasmodium berghei]SCO62920.1 clustered-asparagine-rich protein, putative [Plasmodium berghei]SCO64435.1 clustered-asparagine-rich protein, putative [Plasmodium berghei]|eukprot:XP_034424332.1 clustered-asparagine-rich protein, putative [Plasmodium berghei ANKA]
MSSDILNATIDGVLNTKLHIQNIPPHITDSHLRSALGNAGQIKDICYFNKNKKQINNNFGNNKKIYNTALITFNTHEEALNVLKNIKNLIDTSSEERSIEAKFAVPNLNNNMINKNNMNGNMSNSNNNFQNNFNNENFGNNNMNNFNFYNNNSQNSFMNRNVRNKNTNNIMNINNMNTTQMNNMPMINQNNFMVNNNYKNNKNMNDMLGDDNITPKSANSNINNSGNNSPMFRQHNNNNNVNMHQGNDSALDEYNDNTEGLSLWEIYKDKNNNTFYYNNLTKHSQWNKPIHPNKLFQHNNNEKTKQNGPSGSNLFIFHIPSEWTDLDLFQHFCCFGNIISSKIQRDSTGRNSGFGFVSYDNVMSAHHAIQFMNGYFVNNKYLKVQLKKGEDAKEVQD